MVGWLLDRVLAAHAGARWVGVPLGILGGAATLLAIAVVAVPRRLIPGTMVDTLVPAGPGAVAAAVALLLAGVAAVWVPWRRGRPALALGALATVQAVALLAVTTVRAPQYEARYPARELAGRIRAHIPGGPGGPAGPPLLSLLGDYDFIVAFYVDRPLTPLRGPTELLAARAPDAPRYALVDARDGGVLGQPGVTVLEEGRLGPKRIVLVRLDPPTR
jgi:hypothetical protein